MKEIDAKTIISRTPNGWFGCDYNMNIYKGCCHGCIYCDSRSECYRIENFDEVRIKANSTKLIESELKSKRRTGVIATGAMSDPYNPFEKELELTREALQLVNKYGFGISCATKGDIITRDIDIFKEIAVHSPVCLRLTITAFDDSLSAKIEPHAPVSSKRFKAVEELSKAGLFTGILLMPILPFINDTEENITAIVKRAADAGAKFIYPAFGVTLRQNQRDYFYDKLDKLFPGTKEKYIRRFGSRYQCGSPDAKRLIYILKKECTNHGLIYKMDEIIAAYKANYGDRQLSFL